QNFHTTVVTLDPLLTELNGTLTIVAADTHSGIGAINTNNRVLQPELVSAVSQTDAAGQHLLRQYYVVNPACDQVSAQPNPQCQTGVGQAPQNVTLPALPSLPSLPSLPKCLPTPSPPKLPTPTLSPLPCPTISPPPSRHRHAYRHRRRQSCPRRARASPSARRFRDWSRRWASFPTG